MYTVERERYNVRVKREEGEEGQEGIEKGDIQNHSSNLEFIRYYVSFLDEILHCSSPLLKNF